MPKARNTTPRNDQQLVQIVDAALADAARRSGDWLVCQPGCTQCCIGPFPISPLDAERLRKGMAELERSDPRRAREVRRRARESAARLRAEFPGDPCTGILEDSEEAQERFEGFADDEPCPALDPATGLCDVYAARPMTCRTFGPPMRTAEGGLGVCELCYHGASDKEIAACEVHVDPDRLESWLLKKSGKRGETIVAWVLAEASR